MNLIPTAFCAYHSRFLSLYRVLIEGKSSTGEAFQHIGFGEAGLPPTKPGCYDGVLSDFESCIEAVVEKMQQPFSPYADTLITLDDLRAICSYDPFHCLSSFSEYHSFLSMDGKAQCPEKGGDAFASFAPCLLLRSMFHALDSWHVQVNTDTEYSVYRSSAAVRALLDIAFLDVYGHIVNQPLHELLHPSSAIQSSVFHSFYTASLKPSVDEVMVDVKFGAQHTPLLKIKLNDDVAFSKELLSRIDEFHSEMEKKRSDQGTDKGTKDADGSESSQECYFKWVIDANAAWSPSTAIAMLEECLVHYSHRIFMVEQPFPLYKTKHVSPAPFCTSEKAAYIAAPIEVVQYTKDGVDESAAIAKDLEQWAGVADAYLQKNIYIFGDESISTDRDVRGLSSIMHGVNVKLEKAGGIRSGAVAALTAQAEGKLVWLGIMVTSTISCTAVSMLMPLATSRYGDLDGPLLVDNETLTFEGGFDWGADGRISFTSGVGLGIRDKH